MFVCVGLLSLFHVALWSPAGKKADLFAVACVVFVTFPNVSSSTSELRVRLAP